MARTRVQALLDEAGTIVMPGVYDTLSARIVERTGFRLGFISGYAVSATAIGEPDLGLLTQTEMLERARRICATVDIPLIVDADTGYGNPLNVIRTIRELMAAGAAGCFLEDQQWPKKCGHMRGKKVIDREEYINKVRAAADTRGERDFFIVARTDALAAVGLEEALARMAAARDAGADATFIEAPHTAEQMAEVGRRVAKPTVANMIEGGRTALRRREELADLGFQIAVYPLTGLFAAARALTDIYGRLHAAQTTLGAESELLAFEAFNDLIGVERLYAEAARYGA